MHRDPREDLLKQGSPGALPVNAESRPLPRIATRRPVAIGTTRRAPRPGRGILPDMPRPPIHRDHPRLPDPHPGRARARRRRTVLTLALGLLTAVGGAGCRTADETVPLVLELDADRYAEAFDAVTDVLRSHGLSPTLRDRRSGLIETDAAESAGWFAPWDLEPGSSHEAMATLATIRRSARVSFRPTGFDPAAAVEDLAGPDLLGLRGPPEDLLEATGRLEVRIAVSVERSHRPGLQVDTWSRRLVNDARVGRPAPAEGFEPARTWWPVARDPGLEAAMLQDVAERLRRADADA